MTRRVRRFVAWGLVVALASAGWMTQARASAASPGPRVPRDSPVVAGLGTRVDLSALLRGGGAGRPVVLHGRQLDAIEASPTGTGVVSGRVAVATPSGPASASLREATATSNNWSGYEVEGGPFTAASGSFTVPGIVATATQTVTSEWVGIDGVLPSTTLIQAGVTETYDPATNLVHTQAWWEILPDDPVAILISWNQVSVHPGDSVSVAIAQVSGALWSIGLVDDTTGQTFVTEQSYSGARATAEWIVEAPTDAATGTVDTLGDFTPPVTFSNARVTGPQTSLDPVTMLQGGAAVAVPSALVSGGFTVSYTGTPSLAPTPTPTASAPPALQVFTISAGQRFSLTISGGSPGLAAQWQQSADQVSWTPLANLTLDASGAATYTFTPTQSAYYRVYYPTLGQYAGGLLEVIVAPAVAPTPTPLATPSASPTPAPAAPTIFTVTAGQSVTLDQSGPPNTAFTLQRSPDEATWSTLAQLTTDASGTASYTFVPTATAFYRSLFADGPTPAGLGIVLPAVSPALVLRGPSVITWGGAATLTVAVAPGVARQVQLLATRDDITWSSIASLTTGTSGTASFVYRPATNLYYRAVFAGAPDLAAASSDAVRTVVRQLALPRLIDGGRLATVSRGTSVTFATVLRPDRPELPDPVATFRVYRWTGSAWTLYRSVVAAADATGVATLRWTFASAGSWFVTSMANPTSDNANSTWSAPLRYDVR